MSYLINISSDDRSNGATTDDFEVNFSPSLKVPGNWEMALANLSMWYSWYNISADFNNQTFRYFNSAVWKDIIITPGLYSIPDLNTFIQASMLANGDATPTYHISLIPDFNTFKLKITVDSGFQVDLTVGKLYELLGFTPIIVSTTQEGINNVNITNGIDKVHIHCDPVIGSYSRGATSDVIFSFSADIAPSSLIQKSPVQLIYLPINRSGYFDRMRIRVTDQQDKRLNLNGETVTMTLVLRKM